MSSGLASSASSPVHAMPAMAMGAKQILGAQSGGGFFTDTKVFSRSNRAQTHHGGLPRPVLAQAESDDEEEEDVSISRSHSNTVSSSHSRLRRIQVPPSPNLSRTSSVPSPISPAMLPPAKRPPRKSSGGYVTEKDKPALPKRPNLPKRPPMKRPQNGGSPQGKGI